MGDMGISSSAERLMTNFGLTLNNRGVVTGDSLFEEMYDLTRRVDEDERWTSVWVGDSITAKPRWDSLSLMSALVARTDGLGVVGPVASPRRSLLALRGAAGQVGSRLATSCRPAGRPSLKRWRK